MSKRTFISLEKGFVGLVDETGHPLISPEKYVLPDIPGGMMARIEPSFSEGVMPVSLQSGGAGYIDEDGNVALPFVYEATTPFFCGRAVVRSDGKWGMIDRAGKVMIPFEYDTILYDGTQLSGDRLICVAVNGRFGYITPEGETVIAPVFDDPVGKCSGEFREGVAPVVSDGKKFFIDRSGSLAITPKEEFDYIAHFDGGRAQVLRYDRDSHGILEGFIDKSGSLAVPVQYRQIGSSYSEGVTAVWYEDRVVYISNRGDIIIRTPYTEVTDFSGGIAWGRTDGLWEGFDHDGKVISSVSDAERLIPCPDGRWVAEFKGKYRYADAKNTKTDLQYVTDCPYCLSEGEWLMLCLDKGVVFNG